MDDEQEVIDFLNKIDAGVVGIEKPKINVVTDEGLTVPYFHPEAEDGDNDPAGAEQAWA